LELPDYQVSFGKYAFVLAEIKSAVAHPPDIELDYIKLLTMGKQAVDNLYKDGYHVPVVLIHGRGVEVDVFTISIAGEAVYYTKPLGTFRLVTSPFEFAQLATIGPLISAKVCIYLARKAKS
jgi:hypothetical protein